MGEILFIFKNEKKFLGFWEDLGLKGLRFKGLKFKV
jgi:hypothetical protein